MWWHCFIEQWNGLSMMIDDRKSHPDISLTSDASGTWGCGTFFDSFWFQLRGIKDWVQHIQPKCSTVSFNHFSYQVLE